MILTELTCQWTTTRQKARLQRISALPLRSFYINKPGVVLLKNHTCPQHLFPVFLEYTKTYHLKSCPASIVHVTRLHA